MLDESQPVMPGVWQPILETTCVFTLTGIQGILVATSGQQPSRDFD
jgi:hypothetical protein